MYSIWHNFQLAEGGQNVLEVVQALTYFVELVEDGQNVLEVVQALTYFLNLLKAVSI